MAVLSHYSPEDVIVTIAGLVTIEGFINGSFIKIAKGDPVFEAQQSVDGQVSRVMHNASLYTVSLTLMNTSKSNAALTRLFQVDKATGRGKFPLYIKDSLGGSLFFSGTSWIQGLPDVSYGVEITEREWTLQCADVSTVIGGNQSPSSAISDVFNIITGLL